MILLCPLLIAGKIYKWTDENGKVHFTQTPGPSQELDKIYRDTNKKIKRRKTLSGWWYGTSSGLKYKLQFKDDFFNLSVIQKHGGYSIGKGYFENNSGILTFNYVNSPHSKKKGGSSELYTIVDFSVSRLTLRSEDSIRFQFIKDLKSSSLQSKYAKDLYGIWLNKKNGEILEFKQSSFYIFKKGKYDKTKWLSVYRGNWILNNNTIEFQYVGNSRNIEKIGLTETYSVVYSNELLNMTDTKTGKEYQYKKQLLGGNLLK